MFTIQPKFRERLVVLTRLSKWAEPLADALRSDMEKIAAENAIEIDFVRSRKNFPEEGRVKEVIEKHGEQADVVCAFCQQRSRATATSRGTTRRPRNN
jgi:hypothetical protein